MIDYARKIPNQSTKKGGFPIFTRNNCLHIGMPTTLGYKRNTKFSMGLDDTPENRVKALTIANEMYLDVLSGNYVTDLSYYLSHDQSSSQKSKVTKKDTVTVDIAWCVYLMYAKEHLKVSTLNYARYTIYPVLTHVKDYRLNDAKGICEKIEQITTIGMVIRVLGLLQSILKREFSYLTIPRDPYVNVIRKMKSKQPKVASVSSAKVIPVNEFNYALAIIATSNETYKQLLRFLWFTGCRPSEGIGFSWDDVYDTYIILGNSMVRHDKAWVRVHGSKNNQLRKFPMTDDLRDVLTNTKKTKNPWNLVFTTPRVKPIDLSNFSTHVFKKVLPDYTPYNIRDTFITRQVDNGTPLAMIGKWCDNSEKVIQKRYLAESAIHIPT